MSSDRQISGSDVKGAAVDPDDADRATGLPVFHSWRSVYAFVIGAFVVWVVLLTALQRMFA